MLEQMLFNLLLLIFLCLNLLISSVFLRYFLENISLISFVRKYKTQTGFGVQDQNLIDIEGGGSQTRTQVPTLQRNRGGGLPKVSREGGEGIFKKN